MFKFFVISDKQIKVSNPSNIDKGFVYIYMVGEGNKYIGKGKKKKLLTNKLKFVEIDDIMCKSFETLTRTTHKFGVWYGIDIK